MIAKSAKFFILLFFFSLNCYAIKYINLPICAFGVKNSKLSLYIENDILIKSLTGLKISNNDLSPILPFAASPEASMINKVLKDQPSLTLGHTMPYIYIAINHALDRIYYNSIVRPRAAEDSIRKTMGFDADLNSDGFANIRDMLSIKEIKNQKLTVEIYSTLNSLKQAQSNLRYISNEAFWDPDQNRIGVYIDLKLFRWLPSQVSWGNQSVGDEITAVRDYVSKRLIETMTHELVHFIQYASASKIYSIPFCAEGTAVFLQENISFREDLFKIAGALHNQIADPSLTDSSCRALLEISPPLSGLAMTKLQNGITGFLNSKFNLEDIIMMDNKRFYSRNLKGLQQLYDISLAFYLFVGTIPRDEFKHYFTRRLNNNEISPSAKSLSGLNKKFTDWVRDFAKEWWDSPDGNKLFQLTQNAATTCLNNRCYTSAYMGSNVLISLRNNSVLSWLYIGDVFWRLEIPFFAFDYYARALSVGQKYGFENGSELRIKSRLADSYETLGDLKNAVELYEELKINYGNKTVSDPANLVILLRSELKKEFYSEILLQKKKQSQAALLLINNYVKILQLGGCPTENEYQNQIEIIDALKKNDSEAFQLAYKNSFEEIKKRMLKEIGGTNSLEEVLRLNQTNCTVEN